MTRTRDCARPSAVASPVRRIDGVWRRGPHGERVAVPVGDHAARLHRHRRAPAVGERLAEGQRRRRRRPPSTSPWLPVRRTSSCPAASASSMHASGGCGEYTTRTRSRASAASGALSAITIATACPQYCTSVAGQRRPGGRHEPLARQTGRQGLRVEIVGGQDRGDAGQRAGGRRVDRLDDGRGVRAADEGQRQHARQDDVVEVATATAEQPRIFEPPDPLARVTDRRGDRQPFTRGSTSPAISSSCSSPQSSGLSTIWSTPPSRAAIRALIRAATSSAVPSR